MPRDLRFSVAQENSIDGALNVVLGQGGPSHYSAAAEAELREVGYRAVMQASIQSVAEAARLNRTTVEPTDVLAAEAARANPPSKKIAAFIVSIATAMIGAGFAVFLDFLAAETPSRRTAVVAFLVMAFGAGGVIVSRTLRK